MGILEWAGLGALFLGIMVFCARIMRRGLSTLDDDRHKYMERIHEGEKRLAEDRKNIAALDHISIMRAALEDLMRLEGNPEGFSVIQEGMSLELVTPDGVWHIDLAMRERHLRSAHRVLHGRGRWILSGFGLHEEHQEIGGLMASLNSHLRAEPVICGEPEHLARRIGALHASPYKL